jgi:hypothetical protein
LLPVSSNDKEGRARKIPELLIISCWSTAIYLFIIFQDLLRWPILQFARVVSPIKYRDTSWVLADADCHREIGAGIYGLESDTGCPGYLYGRPLLMTLNLLRIEEVDTQIFVQAMRALFAVALAITVVHLSKKLPRHGYIVALVLLSPGTQLMLYNGNFDLLIFAMVVFGYVAINRDHVIFGLLIIFLSGIFKFYTIPLLLLMLLIIPRIRDKILTIILFVLACISAIVDLKLMQEPIPSSGYAQFGFNVYSKYLQQVGFAFAPSIEFIFSIGVFAVSLLIVILLGRRTSLLTLSEIPENFSVFLLLASVFVACYFTGLSYDPRLIYLTLAGIFLVIFLERGFFRSCIFALVVWSSLLSCGIELGLIPEGETGFHPLRLIQLSNDLAISLITAVFVIVLARVFLLRVRILISQVKNGAVLERKRLHDRSA